MISLNESLSFRFMLSCIGFPECRAVQYFPGFVTDAVPHESVCSKVEREREKERRKKREREREKREVNKLNMQTQNLNHGSHLICQHG